MTAIVYPAVYPKPPTPPRTERDRIYSKLYMIYSRMKWAESAHEWRVRLASKDHDGFSERQARSFLATCEANAFHPWAA